MKKGLGKGLDALFSDNLMGSPGDTEEPSTDAIYVRTAKIEPNPLQPRKAFNEEKLEELSQSILEHGIITPIVVRRVDGSDIYQIIAGERRWRAAKRAHIEEIPVVIKECTDREAAEMALVENLQREDLNSIEEALGYQQLMYDYSMTQDQVSQRVGKSRPTITNTMRLLQLPDDVVELVREGKLSAGHARALIPLGGKASQVAGKIIEGDLSVRAVENLVKKLQKNKPAKELPAGVVVNYLLDIEKSLSQRLGAKVKITQSRKKGKIEVDYYGNEDLERLLSLLRRV